MKRLTVLWTLIAAATAAMHAILLREAEIDRVILRNSGRNGASEIIAYAAVRREGIRLAVALVNTTVGIVALLCYRHQPVTPSAVVIATCLTATKGLILLAALLDFRDRRAALELGRHTRRKGD